MGVVAGVGRRSLGMRWERPRDQIIRRMGHHTEVKDPSRVAGARVERRSVMMCYSLQEGEGTKESTDVNEEVEQRVVELDDIRLKEAWVL